MSTSQARRFLGAVDQVVIFHTSRALTITRVHSTSPCAAAHCNGRLLIRRVFVRRGAPATVMADVEGGTADIAPSVALIISTAGLISFSTVKVSHNSEVWSLHSTDRFRDFRSNCCYGGNPDRYLCRLQSHPLANPKPDGCQSYSGLGQHSQRNREVKALRERSSYAILALSLSLR